MPWSHFQHATGLHSYCTTTRMQHFFKTLRKLSKCYLWAIAGVAIYVGELPRILPWRKTIVFTDMTSCLPGILIHSVQLTRSIKCSLPNCECHNLMAPPHQVEWPSESLKLDNPTVNTFLSGMNHINAVKPKRGEDRWTRRNQFSWLILYPWSYLPTVHPNV